MKKKRMLVPLALLAQVIGLFNSVLCDASTLRIYNKDDFINFTNAVNSGTNFDKTTVFLEDNLDFSEYQGELSPIGKDYGHSFYGIFDGQGFAIDYFIVNTSDSYAGLFGYSRGATIKNLIIGKNSVINLDVIEQDESLYSGSVIGRCGKAYGKCIIENIVNLAEVTFEGQTNVNVYLGGIAGYIYSDCKSYIKNTVNYGTVSSRGESSSATIGGIIGYYSGITKSVLVVSNCLNMGTIMSNENANILYIGGIVGNSEYCTYDNCVSGGKIIADGTGSSTIGSLCGESSDTTFKNCYWSGDAGNLSLGTRTDECASYDSNSLVLDKSVTAGKHTGNSLLEVLNAAVDYYFLYEYSHWGYSTGKYDITFTLNSRGMSLGLESQLFLLPSLSSDGLLWFDGWYTDDKCTEPITDFVFNDDSKLFGKWGGNINTYTVSFDTRGGYPELSPVMSPFSTTIYLSNSITKDYCELKWWENDYGDNVGLYFTTPAHNVTLHAVWSCTKIRTASDLIGIAKVANSGTNYKSVTVSLDNDIEFTDEESNQFESIGRDENVGFEGTFDGKGYTIRNLKIKTTFPRYGGLFGYSKGMTIRNLVLDHSCTVTSSYGSGSFTDKQTFFGSFIGYCKAINDKCNIENSVNMASITFSGNSNIHVFIGGLVGHLESTRDYETNIINCVNYGTVKHSGKIGTFSYIGGLVGGCLSMNKGVFIVNSMNYGTTHSDGESKISYIGGIVGYSVDETNIENCVNIGEIITNNEGSCIGTIIGEIIIDSTVTHCYWDNSNKYDVAGIVYVAIDIKNSTSFDPKTFELTDTISVGNYTGKSLIKSLNSYAELSSDKTYSEMILNKNKKTVTFMVNNRTTPFLTLDSQIIIIPNLTSSENVIFDGWFSDSKYMNPVELSEITENITLYGLYGVKIVVTFDPNNELLNETTKYVILGGPYRYLPTPSLSGYKFVGWLTDNNESVTNETTVTISSDHTLHARWVKKSSSNVLSSVILGSAILLFIVIIGIIIVIAYMYTKKKTCNNNRYELDEPLIDKSSPLIHHDDRRKSSKIVNSDSSDGDYVEDEVDYYYNDDAKSKEDKTATRRTKSVLVNLYPQDYERPSMSDALISAGMSQSQAKSVAVACIFSAKQIEQEGNLEEGLTSNDIAAIAMYTYDFGENDYEYNPYKIINNALIENDKEMLEEVKGLLYLVMSSLRKLPRVTGKTLYRGIKNKINPNNDYYHVGSVVTWPGLSSTSTDMNDTKEFITRNSNNKSEGTLFVIENGWGYDIQPYSLSPEKEEIVLEPERQFKVTNVTYAEIVVINLEMLDTPLSVPEVFGEGKKMNDGC